MGPATQGRVGPTFVTGLFGMEAPPLADLNLNLLLSFI
jgi:Mg2+ and Co2+ transporter CorA